MFFKDPLKLLIECAGSDLNNSTENVIKESAIKSVYASVKEATEDVVYTAEMVPVIKLDGAFVTEMNFLAPYIKSNGIKSISEALDNLAKTNNVSKVGLLIEGDDCLTDVEEAFKNKKSKLVEKFMKGGDLVNKLKSKGHPVIKKKKSKKK